MCWIRQSVESRGKDLSSRIRKAEVSAASRMNTSVESKGREIQDSKVQVCQQGRQSCCMEQRFRRSQSSQSAKIQRQDENYSSQETAGNSML